MDEAAWIRRAREHAEALARTLTDAGLRLGAAESCTGGGIAWYCTGVLGSSEWFEGSLVTYAPEAKQALLGVPGAALTEHGAVSEPVARAMAEGARRCLDVDVSVSVTGIAGPGGGEVLQPVGTVWFGWSLAGRHTECAVECFPGERELVRLQTICRALDGARRMVLAAP